MYPEYYKLEKEEIKDVIYHYTTLEGFKGIIEDRSIWATQISYLNDSSEYRIAIGLMKEILSKRNNWYSQIFDETINLSQWVKNPNVYVCSFSEKDDSLSQWRAYSKNSVGVSIGFKTELLNKFANEQQFNLSKCVYFPKDQTELIDKAISYILDYFEIENPKQMEEIIHDDEKKTTIRNVLLVHVENIAPIIKYEGFYEEAELRLISTIVPDIQNVNFNIKSWLLILAPSFWKITIYPQIKLTPHQYLIEIGNIYLSVNP